MAVPTATAYMARLCQGATVGESFGVSPARTKPNKTAVKKGGLIVLPNRWCMSMFATASIPTNATHTQPERCPIVPYVTLATVKRANAPIKTLMIPKIKSKLISLKLSRATRWLRYMQRQHRGDLR